LCLVILWLSADLFINILFVRKISRCWEIEWLGEEDFMESSAIIRSAQI
jgi:hypothetical protein